MPGRILGRLRADLARAERSLAHRLNRRQEAAAPPPAPDAGFDREAYLAANPDVAAEGFDAWDHYDQYGRAEERRLHPGDPLGPGRYIPPRERFLLRLSGQGIELGPGHNPYPLMYPGAEAQYVDRWDPDQNADLFPELGGASFPKPDIQANLNTDRLSAIADQSQDFVIASHVLEHVANPLAILADMHRVLRPGGLAIIFLPDKRRTFDEPRDVTTLQHLVDEYRSDIVEVDDDHILEFLNATEDAAPPTDPAALSELIDYHRLRSIHVHCWTENDFPAVIRYAISGDGQEWELVDVAAVGEVEDSIEFGFLLRRSTAALDPAVRASRFDAVYARMFRSVSS